MTDNTATNEITDETSDTLDNSQPEVEPSLDDFSRDFFQQDEEAENEETPEVDDDETEIEDQDEDQGEPDDEEVEDDKESEDEESPKPKSRFQERIDQLTSKAREAEREAEALRQRREKLEKADQKVEKDTEQGTPSQKDSSAPDPSDLNADGSEKYPLGEFDPNYVRDLARYTVQKEMQAARVEEEERQRQEQIAKSQAELDSQWQEKVSEFTKTEEAGDFTEKVATLEDTFKDVPPEYGNFLAQTIKSLDNGPRVLKYLADNLDEARHFANAGPLQAVLRLGELNTLFKKNDEEREKSVQRVSRAPVPPQVGTKGRAMTKTISPSTDNLDEFEKVFFKK